MNEALLIVSAALDILLVLGAFLLGRSWVYATIVVNLFLISILGQKLIVVWGMATNVGNVFYAAVLFAMYIIMEHYEPSDARKALLIGGASVVAGTLLMQIMLAMDSAPGAEGIGETLSAAFAIVPRFAFASIFAYFVAQGINIWLYTYSRESIERIHWWLKLFALTLMVQLVDSLIFFTVAFIGTVPGNIVIESITAGYVIKASIGILTIPLLFASHRLARLAQYASR